MSMWMILRIRPSSIGGVCYSIWSTLSESRSPPCVAEASFSALEADAAAQLAPVGGIGRSQLRADWHRYAVSGVIAESSPNCTLSRIEESRTGIPEGPKGILERFRRPNVVAIEG